MRVLVTDGGNRNALAAVRTLGKKGFEVWVADRSCLAQSFYSRYCAQRIRYPVPSKKYDDFVQFMLALVRSRPCDVLLPTSDYSTLFASRHKDELAAVIGLALPDYDALLITLDKPMTLASARQVGIEVPTTHCPRDRDEVVHLSHSIEYPCVVKLRQGAGAVGLKYASSRNELLSLYRSPGGDDDVILKYALPMVQEYVPGEVHDVCLLFDRGTPVASLTQRRLKMYPAKGGIGVLNETTNEPELRERAIALLRTLNWHGPAQVEFKMDSRDRTPKLMEVNGRFWGTLGLAIDAGVDFPYLACQIAAGQNVEPVFDYKVGLRHRWIMPDGLMYITTRKNKFRALKDFLDWRGDTRSEIQVSDPLPFFSESVRYTTKLVASLLRQARRSIS